MLFEHYTRTQNAWMPTVTCQVCQLIKNPLQSIKPMAMEHPCPISDFNDSKIFTTLSTCFTLILLTFLALANIALDCKVSTAPVFYYIHSSLEKYIFLAQILKKLMLSIFPVLRNSKRFAFVKVSYFGTG